MEATGENANKSPRSEELLREKFISLLTEHQNRLYSYIYSLLGDHATAADVLQETNLVLWRKFDRFDPEKQFAPWAIAIAKFQVLASIRDKQRDRIFLDEESVNRLGSSVEAQSQYADYMQTPLRDCLNELPAQHFELIRQKYFREQSIQDIAESTNKGAGAVKVQLLRVRKTLLNCLQRKMQAAK